MNDKSPGFFRDLINQILTESTEHNNHINTTLVRKDGFGEKSPIDITIYFNSSIHDGTWKHRITSIEFDPPETDKHAILDLGGPLTEHEIKKLKHWFHRNQDDADTIASELNK